MEPLTLLTRLPPVPPHHHLQSVCDQPLGHELRIENLSVNYGEVRALEEVNLRIRCAGCLALVGPNGAGKSTLLKSLAGIVTPNSGELRWREKPLRECSAEIAYLAQRSEVDWNFPLTVRGLVEMGRFPHLGWWRRFGKRDREIIDQSLETMRLTDLAGRQISALSGGQQQRAFVARALAQEAHIFLLDEPFTGLDRPSQDLLTELVTQLARDGRLVIASHHDLDTVPDIFDEVLLLNRRPIAFGGVEEVFNVTNLEACFGSLNFHAETSNQPPVPAPAASAPGSRIAGNSRASSLHS
ncbi:MAG: ABC transporter ATP-binding protein [Verrucomicrobiae bacterium]|nr:ABC transporter ATP-binding protein [Verrucomicrobiae bacterium]